MFPKKGHHVNTQAGDLPLVERCFIMLFKQEQCDAVLTNFNFNDDCTDGAGLR